MMNLSYWEIKSWLNNIDFAIIGSGIVGLCCALSLRKKFPEAKIVVFEKGVTPQGASTKNAGFACFGSPSEIIEDLKTHSEDEVLSLIKKRIDGLNQLKELVGVKNIGYKNYGGYEIFQKKDLSIFENCSSQINYINKLLFPLFNSSVFAINKNHFDFQNITKNFFFNSFEGQIDTGTMMESLIREVYSKKIKILNSVDILSFTENNNNVEINSKELDFKCSKLFIATNGFANKLLKEDIKPARAQVLITNPIVGLKIKGTFHLDKGYYYFRNIDNRILLGGGRNLDFKNEETDSFGLNSKIQTRLDSLLKNVILPKNEFTVDKRWSGIMGVGDKKIPVIKTISENVFCGVRLGGMGIAIGASVGDELANKI
tara:strand:+ start:3337 stop:4452 length:1116 start_codon:yes stop_codon:yes gene_type:complete